MEYNVVLPLDYLS